MFEEWSLRKGDYHVKSYFTAKKLKLEDSLEIKDRFGKYHSMVKKYLENTSLKGEIIDGLDKELKSTESLFPFCQYGELAQIHSEFQEIETIELDTDTVLEPLDLFNCIFKTSKLVKIKIAESEFVIPKDAVFSVSDFKSLPRLLSKLVLETTKYDFILMDPPWINSSVDRGSKYKQLDCYDLFQIPLQKIINTNGHVAIWVTNKSKYHDFVKNRLFRDWKLSVVYIIVWLKMTVDGELVMPLDSPHRKPYELCYVGQRNTDQTEPKIHIIKSIPSKIHSRKPHLDEFIDSIAPNAKKLELFGRFVQPNWTCWGNETILLNDSNYLQKFI